MFSGKHLTIAARLLHKARILLWIPGFFLLWTAAGCGPKRKNAVEPAFYYWKTNFRMGGYEQRTLQQTGSKTLYIRLFDVDWDERQQQPRPVGLLQPSPVQDTTLTCIPVVFITQRCLARLQEKDLPVLASRITQLMAELCKGLQIKPPEIQIDCDWTKQRADLYFALLRQIKAQAFVQDKKMSCTIRMHQVKYTASSGIPPVDRGLLMVYNMGNLKKYGPANSILDLKDAKDYMKNIGQYPLPLDVALPFYHWGVLFIRQNFGGLVYNVSEDDFKKGDLVRIKGDLYLVPKPVEAAGYSFKPGTEIRFEHPDRDMLLDIASYIRPRINDSAFRLAYFHLDSFALRRFSITDMNAIREAFQ
ncbi:hypothetical protein [Taibaiella chishuiensis]|uniref:Lipoprotein n=1 Tax=Taibaiella chishuiensis TaxID=1434707 RepID=A0A2P8DDK9_9BACT|nr:hypothetical protein [Taibaiella chishuiensis]PSK95296.1 hypothetical protein B0I18_1011462 [Taibaiella chishuiensis]